MKREFREISLRVANTPVVKAFRQPKDAPQPHTHLRYNWPRQQPNAVSIELFCFARRDNWRRNVNLSSPLPSAFNTRAEICPEMGFSFLDKWTVSLFCLPAADSSFPEPEISLYLAVTACKAQADPPPMRTHWDPFDS